MKILNSTTPKITIEMEYKYLELTIQYVFRANFNDSYYLETIYLDLDENWVTLIGSDDV